MIYSIVITMYIYCYNLETFMSYSIEKTKIRRIGNGRGVLLSKPICNMMGMDLDDQFRVEMIDGRLILVPIRG